MKDYRFWKCDKCGAVYDRYANQRMKRCKRPKCRGRVFSWE